MMSLARVPDMLRRADAVAELRRVGLPVTPEWITWWADRATPQERADWRYLAGVDAP